MPLSERNSIAGKAASTPTAARPTTTALPPARRQSQASRIVSGRPTTSKAWSTPPPVSSRTVGGRVARARIDGVRRPARERELEHRGVAVDGDDRARAREHEAGDDLLPDAAAADHRGALADARPRHVAHRADARDRAAAEQGGLPQRHGRRQRHDAGGRHDGALGEARDGEAVLQRRAVRQREPRGAVHQRAAEARVAGRAAERRPARAAGAARAARGDHAEDDAVARRDVHDALADGLDRPGALVPEHHRPAALAEAAGGEVDVGVADAGRGDAHQHLAGLRRRRA